MSAMADKATPEDLMLRLRGELERPPFNRWLAIEALDASADGIAIRLPYRAEFSYHPAEAFFHGGVIASLIDVAGYAAIAILSSAPTPTVSLAIDYLAPATGPELIARARLRRMGRSLSRVDIDIFAGTRMVALGRGIFSTREPVQ